jgi:hypothetical protein
MARLSADEATLLAMFSYMRPRGSRTEQAFVDRFLTPLGFERDPYQNLVLSIGDAPVLFSAHMDTVHRIEGFQTLDYGDDKVIRLSRKARRGASNCLGADDTAGVWLITEMVKAGVEGTYVIHHGEESGCIGSADLAKGDPEWLSQFRSAIAFDRAGVRDIVTHQMGQRTCSDAFARSLALQLPKGYRPDPTGVYTDTNEYAHIVPECTNISVGYKGQHGVSEEQNVPHLVELRDHLTKIRVSELIIDRDPTNDYPEWGRYEDEYHRDFSENYTSRRDGMLAIVRDYPEEVADYLESLGVSKHDIASHVSELHCDNLQTTRNYGPSSGWRSP